MNWLSNKLFYTIGITLLCGGLHAQSLAEAKKLYNEGKYAEAKPAFEKLVKQAPSNSSYNHWYGVCCYETGDLTGAEKHLKVAVKRKVNRVFIDAGKARAALSGRVFLRRALFEGFIQFHGGAPRQRQHGRCGRESFDSFEVHRHFPYTPVKKAPKAFCFS